MKIEDDSYVEILPSGLNRIHLIEIDESKTNAVEIVLDQFPFWFLSSYFIPSDFVEK